MNNNCTRLTDIVTNKWHTYLTNVVVRENEVAYFEVTLKNIHFCYYVMIGFVSSEYNCHDHCIERGNRWYANEHRDLELRGARVGVLFNAVHKKCTWYLNGKNQGEADISLADLPKNVVVSIAGGRNILKINQRSVHTLK
jgi:beta-galactosidase/beta-glucuronidase